MKSVAEASAEILAAFRPIGSERVPLLSALHRFAATDVMARRALPPFHNSAMDGYALRSGDTSTAKDTPLRLPVIGESRAGGPAEMALAANSAMRIFTGAPLPEGADAVELQENVERDGDAIVLRTALSRGDNVRWSGSDVAEGARVLAAHDEVLAGEIALLASQDCSAISVFRRPRVAILSTGDELREVGEPARPGSIVNSNAYALAAQVQMAGAEPWVLPSARDTREDVARAVREGLKADVLVLSGGVSVGDYDVVREGLADAGVTLGFWKVRMKPGKPVSFAVHGDVPVLGLPGNPVSAWVTFELFVRPGLRKMLGDPQPQRPWLQVRVASTIQRKAGRAEFARARLTRDEAGFVAHLLEKQSSGALSSAVGVDVLLEIPADCERVETMSSLRALLLRPLPI